MTLSARSLLFVAILLAGVWYYVAPQPRSALPRQDVPAGERTALGDRESPAASPETPLRGRTPALPEVSVPPGTPGPVDHLSGLLIPVQGVTAADLVDTYAQERSQGRTHEAIDIMAPAGTPVIAVDDGHVEKLFTSVRGGLTLYQFDPGRRYAYYYAHLQGYAPGMVEQRRVRRGDVLGYVGSTGNADPAAPHLHFGIFVLGEDRAWWKGTALNPYPLLTARKSLPE